MIETMLSYEITQEQTERFRAAWVEWASRTDPPEGIDPLLWQAMGEALQSQLESLEQELEEYDRQYREYQGNRESR